MKRIRECPKCYEDEYMDWWQKVCGRCYYRIKDEDRSEKMIKEWTENLVERMKQDGTNSKVKFRSTSKRPMKDKRNKPIPAGQKSITDF